jgi:DNA polymerase I
LLNYGIVVQPPFFDTMIAHYVCQADGRHNMDDQARNYLNYSPVSITELIGPKGKKQGNMRDAPIDKICEYAAEDADITLQLKLKLAAEMPRHGNVQSIFSTIDMPTMPVLTRMEQNGIRVDIVFLADYSLILDKELQQLETEVYAAAGGQFNIQSPKQLGDVLFERLKLEKGKKTKTGQYSTDEQTLQRLAAFTGHPLPAIILNFREVAKLKSTYVDALPRLVRADTGLVHTSYNQALAVTGRLSSNSPNLQNIPIRTDRGKEIRKAFIPRSEEFTLLSADYSQIELRIMAALSEDEHLVSAFNSGEDVHRATAARVFSVPLDQVSSEMRRRAKMVNFGMIYGITAFGLAERLGISRAEGRDIHEAFFRLFPTIKGYMDNCIQRSRGYAERNAINMPIQGTAADMIKLAMIKLDRELIAQKLKSKLLLQVHDELVLDAHVSELEILKSLVSECMTTAMKLTNVPIEVGLGNGPNWLEAH